jgi:hypothetical protein
MKKFTRGSKAALTAAAVAALAACGGGGDGSGNNGPQPAPNASVGGLWNANFTASNGVSVQARFLVAEDGRFFGTSRNLSNDCVGLSYGTLTTTGTNFTGTASGTIAQFFVGANFPACSYPDGTTVSSSTVTGSVVQRNSITITTTGTSSAGLALGTQTATAQFDPLYNVPGSLSSISGTWTGATGDLVTISASGVVASTNTATGCTLNGTVTVINPSYNAYSATGTVTGCNSANASLNNGAVKALMYLDNTATPNRLAVGQELALTNGVKIVAVSISTR